MLRNVLIGMAAMAATSAVSAPAPLPVARPAVIRPAPVLEPAPVPGAPATFVARSASQAAIRAIVEQEAQKAGLPADVAEAVVRVESGYDPTVIGGVGEIGLMQVRPGTAAMMGFRGDAGDLAKPEVNIHYGVTYLGQAWRLANGDLCRALMKYRAGHGTEIMTPLSVTYCDRARSHLAALGSPLATIGATATVMPAFVTANPKPTVALISPKSVYGKFRQGTPAASHAFWSVQEARVRAITARLHARWHRVAAR